MIRHVAVVPTTPMLLPGWPGAVHPQLARIAVAARRALQGVESTDVVVLLAGAPPAGVPPAGAPPAGARPAGAAAVAVHPDLSAPTALSLDGYGVDLPAHPLAPVDGGSCPDAGGMGHPPVDLRVLARQVPVGTAAVGIAVAPDADVATTTEVAEEVLRLAEERTTSVVCAGDLGAGFGPKPPRPDAAAASARLQDLVVAALDGGRPADLVRLDPALVRDSASRAAGALQVLGAVLDGAKVGTVVRTAGAPLGVGYVVAAGG